MKQIPTILKLKHHRTLWLVVALFFLGIILALTTGISWPLIVINIILCAQCITPLRSATVTQSASVRLLIASIAVLTLYQLESVLYWTLHITTSHQLLVCLSAIIGLIIWLICLHKNRLVKIRFRVFDATLLLPAIIICSAYIARVNLPAETDKLSELRATSQALDDVSHMSMLHALVRSDTNLLIQKSAADTTMAVSSHATYPMGWHISCATILLSLNPTIKNYSVIDFISVYFYTKVATLFIIIFLVTALLFQLGMRLKLPQKKYWLPLYIYTATLFSVVIVVMPQFYEGFFSFLGVFIYALLSTVIILDAWVATRWRTYWPDTVLVLCAVGAALTWVLTAPAIILSYLLLRVALVKNLRSIPARVYVFCGLWLIFFLFQLWDITHASNSAITVLAADGGITSPGLLLIAATFIPLIYLGATRYSSTVATPLYISLAPLLVILSGLMLYLSLSSPSLTYYFYKLGYAALIVTLPVALVCLSALVGKLASIPNTLVEDALRYALFVILLCLSIPSIIGYSYFQPIVARSLHSTLTKADAATLNANLSSTFSSVNERVLFYFPSSAPRSIMASHLARTAYPNSACDSKLFDAAYRQDIATIGATANECSLFLPQVTIYTDAAGASILQATIPANLIESREVVVSQESP